MNNIDHMNCTCPLCCPGKWEVNTRVYGGLVLGPKELIAEYSYEINNPTKAEIAVDAVFERNR